jgi:ribonuclease J
MSRPHRDLTAPPELPQHGLRVIPLGGIGEIGRNMTVFEHAGKLLIVDCGVLFPEEHQPGVDLILPDFSYLRDRYEDVVGVVLTHGHEDHIGAVPYLLREAPDLPLVGSTFTLALVEAKLREHRIKPYSLTVTEGQRERLGPFELEFLSVNHSIPDALAVAIRTEAGLVLHTGDFKMDQLPLDGRLTDLGGFARLGAEGVDLLLADSTARSWTASCGTPSARSSWPVSPRTCTGSSRCSTPPPRTTATWPSSVARWCGTWAWQGIWACSPCRRD